MQMRAHICAALLVAVHREHLERENVATVRAKISSLARFKTLRETAFARRVLPKWKARTFQNAIPSSKLALGRNAAAIRKNATMHAGLFFEFAKSNRAQIGHAIGMTANPRPRLVNVVPFKQRAFKRSINRPNRCRHMRLRRAFEAIGVTFKGTKNHLFIDRFLLIERLESFNVGNQSGAIAVHRFHMHSPRTSKQDRIDSLPRAQNRKPAVSHQRKMGQKVFLLPHFRTATRNRPDWAQWLACRGPRAKDRQRSPQRAR